MKYLLTPFISLVYRGLAMLLKYRVVIAVKNSDMVSSLSDSPLRTGNILEAPALT